MVQSEHCGMVSCCIPSSFLLEAPGEAEAELAALNQQDFIDMVLTTDSDAIVFGMTCIACWYVFRVHAAW